MNLSTKLCLPLWGLTFLALWAPLIVFGQPLDKTSPLKAQAILQNLDEGLPAPQYYSKVPARFTASGISDNPASLAEPVRFPHQNSQLSLRHSCPVVLAVDEVLLFWGTNDSLAFSRSTDGGLTWEIPGLISYMPGYWPTHLTGIRTQTGRIIIVWRDFPSLELMMNFSDNDGNDWSGPHTLTFSEKNERWTTLSQDVNGTLWLFYGDYGPEGDRDIYYITSNDDGDNWSAEQTLLATPADEWYATVVSGSSSSDLLLFYGDNSSGNFDIYQMTSNNGGQSWSSPSPIANDPADEISPRVLPRANGELWMIYQRRVPSPVLGNEEYDIYSIQSTGGITSWSQPQRFTEYVSWDGFMNADLLNNQPFVSFGSYRWANWNQSQIWYGIIDVTTDSNPPPALFNTEVLYPFPNTTISIRAHVDDESGVSGVTISYMLNGSPAGPFQMFDDGLHNDNGPGDNIWGVEIGPFQLDDVIDYSFSITDVFANNINVDAGSFQIPAVHNAGNIILSFHDNSQLAEENVMSGTSAYYPASGGEEYLYLGGLWIGADLGGDQRVMNTHYPERDWTRTPGTPFTLAPGISDQDGDVTYDDQSNPPNPLGLQVQQQSFQWSDPDYDDFIIFRYTVTNTGLHGDLNDIYTALWCDPDLIRQDHGNDLGGFDDYRGLLYLYDSENNPDTHFGIKLLGEYPHTVSIQAAADDPQDDPARFGLMTGGIGPFPSDPADHRILLTVPPFFLAAGESHTVTFGLVMGSGVEELQSHTDWMISRAEEVWGLIEPFPAWPPNNVVAIDKLDGEVALYWDPPDGSFSLKAITPDPEPEEIERLTRVTNPVTESALLGYNVYRGDSEWGPFDQIANLPPDQYHYLDNGVSNEEVYYYYLTSVYDTGEGPPSNMTAGYPLTLPNTSGKVVAYTKPGGRPYGIASDGSSVWMCDFYSSEITQYDPFTWQPLGSIPAPEGGNNYGLAWDGTYLWVANLDAGGNHETGRLYQIDLSGNILQFFGIPPGNDPKYLRGVAYENGHVWTMAIGDGVVHKFDAVSGTLLETIPMPLEIQESTPRGIAYLPNRNTFIVSVTYNGQSHSKVYEVTTNDFTLTGRDFEFDMEYDPGSDQFNSSVRAVAYNSLTGNYWIGDVWTDMIYEVLPFYGHVGSILVTNTNDDGPGSLREAIDIANNDGQSSLIEFHPALMWQTIYPQTELPALTDDNTTIDGDINADGLPDVEISRDNPEIVSGLVIESAFNTVKGLLINHFNGPGGPGYCGIRLTGANSHDNSIIGCYIGTDLSKSENRGNRSGILIFNDACDNTIGGSQPGEGNIIFNNAFGLYISGNGTIGNTVTHNSIAHNNTGIRVVDGANNGIVPPAITAFENNTLSGTTVPNATVEIFADMFNQGEEFLGDAQSDGAGNFDFSGDFPVNRFYNATVTDPGGNTSAFSIFYRQNEINANHWRVQLLNDGRYARDVENNIFGGDYPKNSGISMVYAAGHYLGTLKEGTPSVSQIEFESEYIPGKITNPFPAPIPNLSADYPLRSRYKVYVIDSTRSGDDWNNWPVEDGAPVDANGDPLLISQQDSWTVCNDVASALHRGTENPVLGIEIQRSTYSYTFAGAVSDVFFVKWRIINKSNNNYPDTYFSVWFDPDVADPADDLIGTDTTLQMAFCYNGNDSDIPKAFGTCLLKGPVEDGQLLGLTATSGPATGEDPTNDDERYNLLRGLDRWGDPKPFGPFDFSGDPLANIGYLDVNPADKRLILSSGPFTFYAGNVQEIVVACIGAVGNDRLDAVAKLKETTRRVQEFYNRPVISVSQTRGISKHKTPVRISLSNVNNLLGADFKIQYNNSILELSEDNVSLSPLTADFTHSVNVTQNQGVVSVALAGVLPADVEIPGILVKLPFKVKKNAPVGDISDLIFTEAALTLQSDSLYQLFPAVANGSLEVVDGYLFGDVNRNGVYDLADAVFILKAVVELYEEFTPFQELLADADESGIVEVIDALQVLNQLVLSKQGFAKAGSSVAPDTMVAVNLSLPLVQGEAGQEIQVPVSSNDFARLNGLELVFRYDQKALRLVSVEKAGESDLLARNLQTGGRAHIAVANTNGIGNGQGELVLLNFKLLLSGEHLITVEKSLGAVPIEEILGSQVPQAFHLSQNYPNPFNAVTTIRYQLPERIEVKLEIFNVRGQQVATLVDRVQNSGYYSVKWDAGAVSSGLYFYRLSAGEFSDTRKLILIK